MTTKHTPGPWLSARNHRWGHQVVARTDGGTVTVTHLGNADFDEENARLIAAAPDLLAACEALAEAQRRADVGEHGGFGLYVDAMQLARAAIAKAKKEKP